MLALKEKLFWGVAQPRVHKLIYISKVLSAK